ncbi:MAG: enoyl-CoA hydratase/isomerase family protein [Actinobacteria bacterium]|nr:enoyl-CoA hydratase/isomerase family protein [Actinomycetota bacterium]
MGTVRTDRGDRGIAVVTLDDADRRNAMTSQMGAALHDAITDLAVDDELRVAVLTGAGAAFSAGGDLAMLEEHARAAREEGVDASAAMRRFYRAFLSVRELPVPVVAAVNGHAIGAGACLAFACDLVVVADDARIGLTFARVGLHPGMGGSWLLPRLVGRQRAAELLYTGRVVRGRDVAAWGGALEALPVERVLPRAMELAGRIAGSAPRVVRQLKVSLRDTWARSLDEQLDAEAAYQARNYASDDVAEGIAAARERRPPRFTGS